MKNPSPAGKVKKGSPALSQLIINTYHLLYGYELEDIGKSHIVVENGVIKEINHGFRRDADYTVGAVLPLPVNAHTHLNDYRVPEHCIGYNLSTYAGSKGVKHPLIQLIKNPILPKELAYVMAQYSIVVDYQEHFWRCNEFREELSGYGVKYIGLSRPTRYDLEEIGYVLKNCDGIGISNPLKLPSWVVIEYAQISNDKIVSAHVSETKTMEEHGSLHYLLNYRVKPPHIVHGVYLEDWEYKLLADEDIVLVVNPRSNLWFTGKLPRIDKALKYGVKVAVGTDNAGCFHPDVWVDTLLLETIYKDIDPKIFLEMTIINGYYAVKQKPLIIREGEKAYFMGVDLGIANDRSGNIYGSIINRVIWSPYKIFVKENNLYIHTVKYHFKRLNGA
ncbi:amidohydrolase family protein [Staphylothermus hellenicus]|uniref:Amidohydrolase n=1 Tax=Staphylothermus hellenicus (strain DSM 12710 / JCM 10830 / BK20S6-10-b1 / P8) TaxID=591019 RepID=D7DB98_STAHD|nr:amidohydrolase family protein [Staphylothermus hellenicus]ADI31445.1 amidohydrolase [Staphylothermus hellenicus DSM 12710]